jgi:hypothetical protein
VVSADLRIGKILTQSSSGGRAVDDPSHPTMDELQSDSASRLKAMNEV